MARKDGKKRGHFERPRESGIWWVCYFDERGEKHREKVGNKTAAREVYAKRKTQVRDGKFHPEDVTRRKVVTVKTIVERYLEVTEHNRSHKTDLYFANAVLSAFRDVPAEKLNPHELKSWMQKRSRETSPSTANRTFGFLKRACRKAVLEGAIKADPTSKVKPFREPSGRIRFLTEEEELRLRAVVGR